LDICVLQAGVSVSTQFVECLYYIMYCAVTLLTSSVVFPPGTCVQNFSTVLYVCTIQD